MNYEEIYRKYISDYKINGNEISCLCPFHREQNPSFNINKLTGQYQCFSCGVKGNVLTFISEIDNIDTKEAWKKLNNIENIKYTVEQYSFEKKLPIEFLKQLRIKKRI